MQKAISQLVEYALKKGWLTADDRIWAANRLLEIMQAEDFDGLVPVQALPPLQEILDGLCRSAYARGLLDGDSAAYFDLFDTKLMGALLPRPDEVIETFRTLYRQSPKAATDWYYGFSGDSNYIRRARIAKDRKWTVQTPYGVMDITINRSKPEKDPRAIAAAAKAQSSGYPKCLLCCENEGYAGRLNHPARQNHRIIPLTLCGAEFYLQYSPYVYYHEHCIVLNREHVPMHIDRQVFENLLDFVTQFPHYFLGSNADLPIVGGSVLSHDHYQGGNYTFAMARAAVEQPVRVPGYADIAAGIVKWPMSVIRLTGADRARLAELAAHILAVWRTYDDAGAQIVHATGETRHNTITPIARRRGTEYELDLVLRNNRTTQAHPLGLFHPHADKHHIKKENIGLIEVMGLAVLPARLQEELDAVANALLAGRPMLENPLTAPHAAWAEAVAARHPELCAQNVMQILQQEVGAVFCAVLEDAGVFKRTAEGQAAFERFLRQL